MSFNFPRLALVSASVVTFSILSGCSSLEKDFQASSQMQGSSSAASSVDPYDRYYGSPEKNQAYNAMHQTKSNRTVIKPLFKVNAPRRYVVKKGDTLWGISNMFLNNPAYWPEIWDVNQKLANPHRIYPGDVLYIYEGGKRKIKQNGVIVEKLVPQMRIERNGSGEPISTLMPFLVWPRVLDKDTIENAPYIVTGKDANLLIEQDQLVYVKGLRDRHSGGRYAIFHPGKVLIDPETDKELGNHVDYAGFLEVDQPALGAEVASATVAQSLREIRPGDRLLAVKDEKASLNQPIIKPNRKVRGTIMSLVDANLVVGQTKIIVINKGARQGIKLGYTLGVYRPGRTVNDPIKMAKTKYEWDPVTPAQVALPPARVATAIVYKVLGNMSYALVTESDNAIKNGYKIGNP